MKYNTRSAILNSEQAEDTVLSMDIAKTALKIAVNDEYRLLLNKKMDKYFLVFPKKFWCSKNILLPDWPPFTSSAFDWFRDRLILVLLA